MKPHTALTPAAVLETISDDGPDIEKMVPGRIILYDSSTARLSFALQSNCIESEPPWKKNPGSTVRGQRDTACRRFESAIRYNFLALTVSSRMQPLKWGMSGYDQ